MAGMTSAPKKPAPSKPEADPIPATLRTGDSGDEVTELQRKLVEAGAMHSRVINGKFGPVTENAVRLLQERRHLTVDGVVGPETWRTLT